jgi:acyl carrier protein
MSGSGTKDPVAVVVGYLLSKKPEIGEIPPDLDLIENRVLDSLGFVNFLYLLEELTGREIPMEEVAPDDFRTVNAIEARFLR